MDTHELKFLAMDIATDIITNGLSHKHVQEWDIPPSQREEVTEMVRKIMLALLAAMDDKTMLEILEDY